MTCQWAEVGPKDDLGRRLVRCDTCHKSLPSPTAATLHLIAGCLNGDPDTGASLAIDQAAVIGHGPGTEAARIFKELGIEQGGCKCPERQRQMDQWGEDGCQANRATIIAWFKEAASELTLVATVATGAKLMRTDWFDRKRPHDSILSEAIRRARTNSPAPA